MTRMLILLALLAALAPPALSQGPMGQAKSTAAVAFLDGIWIGPASMTRPDGTVDRFEQMERIGPMNGGEVRIMEGKGRDRSGRTVFNASTVLSQDEAGGIRMRTWTMGHESARELKLRPDGFAWEIAAGTMTIRYTATVRNGVWDEVGERVSPDGKAVRFFEMRLKRVGATGWPAENPAFATTP